ncbi:MAG TPA: HlyD family efflux transporter periplasmic adaptor subunit [Steroidobacteraceae bacterium]|nr:HlyD family efflux transporter periplasmic adaptor subunit [Steroidobacteraceae bacterium]
MPHKGWIFGIAALLAALVAIAWLFAPRPVPVETATVERGVFTLHVEEDGVTRVRDRFVIAAPVSGMLMRVSLRVGDRVSRGDVVAMIVPNPAQMLDARTRSELAARVEAAAAQAARAGALLRQTEAAALQAQNEHRRLEELGTQGFASQTERERSALTLDLRRKDAEAARFEEDAARHDLEQARAALRQGDSFRDGGGTRSAWSVRAPIDGTVLAIEQESEIALAIGAPIMEIGDLRRLEARIDVLSTEATRIEESAYVDLDAGGVRLAGRVRRIEPSGYTKVSALGIEEQRVDVLVDLLPNPVALRQVGDGYRVDAVIEIARQEDALRIPLSALFRQGESWATFCVVNGRARLTPVRIGLRGNELATVVGGLDEGAVVIAYPSDAVLDGVRVRAY